MSVIEEIWGALAAKENAPILVELLATGQQAFSAAQVLEIASKTHSWLVDAGVEPGDRVGLLGNNSAAWAAIDLGVIAAGGVVVPLYARQAADELAHMLKDCDAKLVLAQSEELAAPLRDEHGLATHLWDEPLATEAKDYTRHAFAPDDLMTLIYTSGTSGTPKGVELTRKNIDTMLPVTKQRLDEALSDVGDERGFHYLPFCFAGSRFVLWTQLLRAKPLYLSMDLERLTDEIAAARPHWFLNVPTLLERIRRGVDAAMADRGKIVSALYGMAHRESAGVMTSVARQLLFPKIRERLGGEVRFLICGSAPLAPETQDWFSRLELPVLQVYGLTETTAILTMDRPGAAKPGWVGTAIGGVELKLGDEGELFARGDAIFRGYWNMPEETAEAISEDGWFSTGDLAELDEAGRVRILGRARSLLVLSSGHNVSPEQIEERLQEAMPQVENVVVIGHGRPWLSALVFGPVSPGDVDEALARANASLPHYRKVHRLLHIPESLTPESGLLTANGKLRRAAIDAAMKDKIDALYREARK